MLVSRVAAYKGLQRHCSAPATAYTLTATHVLCSNVWSCDWQVARRRRAPSRLLPPAPLACSPKAAARLTAASRIQVGIC